MILIAAPLAQRAGTIDPGKLVTMPKVLLIVLAFAAGDVFAEPRPPAEVRERRNHFEIVAQEGAVLYQFTEISRTSDTLSEEFVLVRDVEHGDFVLRQRWSFGDQMMTRRLSDLRDRVFVQLTMQSPFTSKTREETLAESRRHPSIKMTPGIVKVETNGGRWDAVETEWEDAVALRQFRYRLRASVDGFLLEAVERLRGMPIDLTAIGAFFDILGHLVVYGPPSPEPAIAGTKRQTAAPDCAFDAHFGFPCSAKQLDRIKKAAASGSTMRFY
jgi:hypothetical protein